MGALTKKLAEILQPKYKERMQTGATTVAVVPGKRAKCTSLTCSAAN